MKLYLPIEVPDHLALAFHNGVIGLNGESGDPLLQAERAIQRVLGDHENLLDVRIDDPLELTGPDGLDGRTWDEYPA